MPWFHLLTKIVYNRIIANNGPKVNTPSKKLGGIGEIQPFRADEIHGVRRDEIQPFRADDIPLLSQWISKSPKGDFESDKTRVFRRGENGAVEAGEGRGGGDVQRDGYGAQRLMLEAVARLRLAVFRVAQKRVPQMREDGSDLMCAAGVKEDFEKRFSRFAPQKGNFRHGG